MPELPEVEVVRRSLAPLVGGRLTGVSGHPIRLRRPLDPGSWCEQLAKARLEEIGRRGKYLLLPFGSHTAVLHLGMSGRLLVGVSGIPDPPHTHLRFIFDDGKILRFVDPRRFGMADLVPAGEVDRLPYLASLGEDALLGDVKGVLDRVLPRSRSTVWSVLLNQKVLAGVGNIYATEALHRAGIRPLRRAQAVSSTARKRLAGAVKAVLAEAVEQGGTTLADGGFVDGSSRGGYFAVRLRVYARGGRPCLHCGAGIIRRPSSGRSVYFCPRCQR